MPSRAYTSFLPNGFKDAVCVQIGVSMPSRAYTSFLRLYSKDILVAESPGVNALSGLYLISTRI